MNIGNWLGLTFRGTVVEFGADVTLPRSYVCLETMAVVVLERQLVRPCLVPYVRSYPLPLIFTESAAPERPFVSLAPTGHILGTQRVDIDLTGVEYRSACALQMRKVLAQAERLLPVDWTAVVEAAALSYVVVSKIVGAGGRFPGSNS